MMGYIYLCIALISGAIKGFCGKKTSSLTSTFYHSVLANLIRMSFCIIIGFAVVCSEGNFNLLLPDADVLLIALISGISTAVFVVSWLVSVRQNTYMLMDVFLMLGVLVPLTLGQLLFNEAVRPVQWLGLGILFAATLIMCSYNNSIKTKLTFPAFSLLLLCGFSGGVADFTQKLFTKTSDAPVSVFNLYTYIFTALTLVLVFSLSTKDVAKNRNDSFKRAFPYILVMAICLFLNSYYKTIAAVCLPSVILYPLNQALALILSTVVSAVFFHEKITLKAVIGIFIAFVGLLFINLL